MFLIYVHISDDISYFMALTFESSKHVTAIHTRYKAKKKKTRIKGNIVDNRHVTICSVVMNRDTDL